MDNLALETAVAELTELAAQTTVDATTLRTKGSALFNGSLVGFPLVRHHPLIGPAMRFQLRLPGQTHEHNVWVPVPPTWQTP